ncbi:MBL fold metallo-hydrolase [Aquabacterium sp. J223]|uniref:MBL fold metallo-hydrolase n=1 Tax=Aquabacterium sp. J223 TaxID=2898431 RepID=UPI0021AD5C26|nr:MBL fold metallo-hydrolase [Aquabacterium sp. J223]UUX95839.1 MBL fold metallo-hydrolase [Aquabacterium sp. J223]
MANALEDRIRYPLGDRLPEPGGVLEVAPGVRWLRQGLPFALDHVNCWLLRDELDGRAGWTVVDCGADLPAARAAWDQVVERSLDGLPLLRVVVTHLHPDHLGLAHRLCERFGREGGPLRLWMSATDFAQATLAVGADQAARGETAARFAASHGLAGDAALEGVRRWSRGFRQLVPAVPSQFRRLQDGQRLAIGGQPWQAIAGYGHAPEHIALHAPASALLIAGDMVLPRISTNVAVHDNEPEADPLALYLASLQGLRALPADTLVLPSHGKPFGGRDSAGGAGGLHERIDQLLAHHEERLAETLDACQARPCSAADIVPVMFPRALDPHQLSFALGEALAHLHTLWHRGRLRRTRGTDGVWRFASA